MTTTTTCPAVSEQAPSSGHAQDLPLDQLADDLQKHGVEGGPEVQTVSEAHITTGLGAANLELTAATFDDLERTRIAAENRVRSMEQGGVGSVQQVMQAADVAEALKSVENSLKLQLERAMRAHPLGPWVKRTVGLGDKQTGRLIAAIGDPYWNHLDDRPRRGPAELWAYCGLHTVPDQLKTDAHVDGVGDGNLSGGHEALEAHARYAPAKNVAAKRRKGVKSNWNAQAKMRAHLCAESCIKQMHSPYRKVYDHERAKWADRQTTDMHKHNHALRVVSKEILKDLYLEAKRIHQETTS